MRQEAVKSWLDAYGRAWETRNPHAAVALFAEGATYQETPFDAPLRGRDAIFDYWAAVPRLQDRVQFDHEVLAVIEDVAIAHWRATFVRIPSGTRVGLDAILTVRLDAENRCQVFREWWHRLETEP